MFKYFSINRFNKGFTLVETVVSIGIFMVMATIVTGIFLSALHISRKSFDAQRIVEDSLLAFESMARDIRVGKIEDVTNTSLVITHPVKGLIVFTYDSTIGAITKTEGGATATLTSRAVNISRMSFLASGLTTTDNRSPRVTIVATAKSKGVRVVTFDLQTTVTSRDLIDDFQF